MGEECTPSFTLGSTLDVFLLSLLCIVKYPLNIISNVIRNDGSLRHLGVILKIVSTFLTQTLSNM